MGQLRAVAVHPTVCRQRTLHRPDDSLEFVMLGRRDPAISGQRAIQDFSELLLEQVLFDSLNSLPLPSSRA